MKSGFHALLGNPPWVSYAGRAAQPLERGLRAFYAAAFESFSGYRNLQGLFIERSATLLRPSGRLGLVVPSSMSEQAGYGPTRLAHDAHCACDEGLRDLGEEGFEGVFQPCMALVSTRREHPVAALDAPWPMERRDLDAASRDLLERMGKNSPLPGRLFGERGLQTRSEDLAHFRPEPDDAHRFPMRCGADIEPFRKKPPSIYADASQFGKRLRTPEVWGAVRVLVRQTARFPMASLSDGTAFRNSILAGFEDDAHPAPFLVAYLNATPIRWLHYVRHRDARQGMPQMKIGHLRATPAPPRRELVGRLGALGEALSRRNEGASPADQDEVDELVAAMFELSQTDRQLLRRFRETFG